MGCTAIILAGGRGSRMNSDIPKQYMDLNGKPVLFYSLKAFEENCNIEDIILVTGDGEETYCRKEVVEKYGFLKVNDIVPGGSERYLSVYQGLLALQSHLEKEESLETKKAADTIKDRLVYIHDGARPCISSTLIDQLYEDTLQYGASIAAVPVKDTIKIVDAEGFVTETPDRSALWQIQTPQVFSYPLIMHAYEQLMQNPCEGITDDAMVLEKMTGHRIHITPGSYENIKITTAEDIAIAQIFLNLQGDKSANQKEI